MPVLVDTNVVSELISRSPNAAVENWAAAHVLEDLFFSAVGEAELRYGVAILAAGRRRETLIADIEAFLRSAFDDRILPFDSAAARAYANIAAMRRSAGRPTQPADCQIAAVARSLGMTVATRNVRDFEGMGIDVVDPLKSTDTREHHLRRGAQSSLFVRLCGQPSSLCPVHFSA